MNQVLLRGMSDEEFLSAVRDDAKTDLEIMMLERIEAGPDELNCEDCECDGDCGTAFHLQEELDDAKRYIAKLCEFVQEEHPNHALLEDSLCPV